MKILIVIPARLKATRLPNKPLAMIGDAPMIVQVWRRAMASGVGEVVVACDGEEIAAAVRAAGGEAIVTNPDHPSGSDRVWEAVLEKESRVESRESSECAISADTNHTPSSSRLTTHDARLAYDIIINLQGDVPTLEPRLLRDILLPLHDPAVDIATLAAEIQEPSEHMNPSVVKVVLGESRVASRESCAENNTTDEPHPSSSSRRTTHDSGPSIFRALYFSRAAIPHGEGPRYHHIGVYAYRRAALEQFVQLPPSPLELREKLEQLRALEAGLRIDAVVVDTVPLGVDTQEDLEKARTLL